MAKIHFDITGDNSNLVSTINDSTKRLEHFSSLMKDLGKAGLDMSTPKAQLKSLNTAITENEKVIKDYVNQLRELEKAQREAAASGKTTEVNSIGAKMAEIAGRMQSTIVETNTLKNAYGELSSTMNRAGGVMQKFLGGAENYKAILSQLPPGLRMVTTELNAMTGAAKAFIATPLGVVLAGLLLSYKALDTWLNKTAEGQMALAGASGYLNGVMVSLEQVVKDLGHELYKLFTEPKEAAKDFLTFIEKQFIVRFKAFYDLFKDIGSIGTTFWKLAANKGSFAELGQAWKEVFSNIGNDLVALTTGFTTEQVGDFIENLDEAGKKGQTIGERELELRKKRSAWQVQEAKLDKEIAEQRNKMYTGSTEERAQAAARAEELINQKYAKRIELAREEYNIQKEKNSWAENSVENIDAQNRLEAQIIREQGAKEGELRMFIRRGHSADEAGIRAEQQAQDALTALIFQNEEKRIAMIEDEGEREAEARNLKYKKALAEIAKTRRDWEEQNRLTTDDSTLSQEQEDALAEAKEIAEEELLAGAGKTLRDLLDQYKTYEDQKAEIIKEGEEEVKTLESAGYTEQAKLAKEAMEKRLTALDRQNKDIYKRLAQDTSKWGIVAVQKAIADAEQELEELSSTPEKARANADAIQYLTRAIEGLRDVSKDFTFNGILSQLLKEDESGGKSGAGTGSFAERFEALKKNWNSLSEPQKWKNMGGWASTFAKGLGKAASYMKEIAEASGNTNLKDVAESMEMMGTIISSTAQGAASNGAAGAFLGFLTGTIETVLDSVKEFELYQAKLAQDTKDWQRSLELLAITVKESDFSTIFGDKSISKAQAYYKQAIAALNTYREYLRTWGNAEEEFHRKNRSGTSYNGKRGTQGNGNTSLWGYLQERAPQIFDNEGLLDVEKAKEYLATQTRIDDELKKQIQHAIDLRQAYDEALKAMDNTISQTFGDIASDVTDIIWDSVMNGTDAWTEFQKVGSEAITKLGKQLIQEMLISTYLEQFRDRMRSAYSAESIDDTQKQMREIVTDIFGGMNQAIAAGQIAAEEWKNWAEVSGYDLTKLTAQSQNATAGAFQTMSQDTASELNGRFTAFQLSNELISQSAQAGVEFLSSISNLVSAGGTTLTEIRNFHMLEVGYLEDIAKQTKPILSFVDTLDKIKENTDRL